MSRLFLLGLFILGYEVCFASVAKDNAAIEASATVGKKLQKKFNLKFDLILDEDINKDDPRIKSVIYSAKSYSSSTIKITYLNPNAEELALRLANTFTNAGLKVFKPQKLRNTGRQISRYVDVTINYQDKK